MRSELPELSEYQLDCLQHIGRSCYPSSSGVLCWHSEESCQGDTRRHRFRIKKARTGKVIQRQLQQWASMLLLNNAFDWSGEDEDAIADRWVLS